MGAWLVTIDDTMSDDEAIKRLVAFGAVPDLEAGVVQLDESERAISVSADAKIADGLSDLDWVCDVFPNSELHAY